MRHSDINGSSFRFTKCGVRFGEKTPTVFPSSFTATPISAKTASLCTLIASVFFSFSSHVSFSSTSKNTSINQKLHNYSHKLPAMSFSLACNWSTASSAIVVDAVRILSVSLLFRGFSSFPRRYNVGQENYKPTGHAVFADKLGFTFSNVKTASHCKHNAVIHQFG